jgi:hypothetical protein
MLVNVLITIVAMVQKVSTVMKEIHAVACHLLITMKIVHLQKLMKKLWLERRKSRRTLNKKPNSIALTNLFMLENAQIMEDADILKAKKIATALIFVDLMSDVVTRLNTLVEIHQSTRENVLTISTAIPQKEMELMVGAIVHPTVLGTMLVVKSCQLTGKPPQLIKF